jgi:RNA polymerase sigma factor (sigma-70 family)
MDSDAVVATGILADRIRDGDRAAEDEFVARYYGRVLVMCQVRLGDPEIALDLAQEAIIGALRGVRDGRLNAHEHLAAYLLGTARNLINNHFRSEKAVVELTSDPTSNRPIADEIVERNEQVSIVHEVIAQLEPVDRSILRMTLTEGMKPSEIAKRLGMKPELVRKRKSRAVRRVREFARNRSRNGREDHC